MKAIVGYLLAAVIEAIARQTRKGSRTTVRIGFAVGFIVGGLFGIVCVKLLAARLLFMFLGGIVGAIVSANLFPKSTRKLGEAFSQSETASGFGVDGNEERLPGDLLRHWDCLDELGNRWTHRFVGVLEEAIYVASTEDDPEQIIVPRLENGEAPDVIGETLIWLRSLGGIQIDKPGDLHVTFLYREGHRDRRVMTRFADMESREDFLGFLESRLGKPFDREQRELSVGDAICVPAFFLLVLVAIFLGMAYLSTIDSRQPIVESLETVGCKYILLTGLVPCLPLTAWVFVRALAPPKVFLLAADRNNLPD